MVMESLVVALLYIQLPSWRGWEEGLLKWVGGALGGEKGDGLVKLSTSGLDRSERTCKISNYSYNCYVKRVEDRFPLFPVTTTGKCYLCT